MSYPWPHLERTEVRGTVLFSKLVSYLKQGDRVLDVCCGYSPLAKPLLENRYLVAGFDREQAPIDYLNEHYPRGHWLHASVEKFYGSNLYRDFRVLLLLGPDPPQETVQFQQYLRELVAENHTEVVLLDTWLNLVEPPNPTFREPKSIWHHAYNADMQTLLSLGFKIADSGIYDPENGLDEPRFFIVMKRDKSSES